MSSSLARIFGVPRALFRAWRLRRSRRARERLRDADAPELFKHLARFTPLTQLALLSRAVVQRAQVPDNGDPPLQARLAEIARELDWEQLGRGIADNLMAVLMDSGREEAEDAALGVLHAFRRGSSSPLRSVPAVIQAAAARGLADEAAVRGYAEFLVTSKSTGARTEVLAALRAACDPDGSHPAETIERWNRITLGACGPPWAAKNLGQLALGRDDFRAAAEHLRPTAAGNPLAIGLVHLGLGAWGEAQRQVAAVHATDAAGAAQLDWLVCAFRLDCQMGEDTRSTDVVRKEMLDLLEQVERLRSDELVAPSCMLAQELSLRRRLLGSGAAIGRLRKPVPGLRGNAARVGARSLHAEVTGLLADQGGRYLVGEASSQQPTRTGSPELPAERAGAELLGLARWRLLLGRVAPFSEEPPTSDDPNRARALVHTDLLLRSGRIHGVQPDLLRRHVDPLLVRYACELLMRYHIALGEPGLVLAALAKPAGLLLSPALRELLRAEACSLAGEWQSSIQACEAALTAAPRSSSTWSGCGWVQLTLGLDDRASACFRAAQLLDPWNMYAALGVQLSGSVAASITDNERAERAPLIRSLRQTLRTSGREDLLTRLPEEDNA